MEILVQHTAIYSNKEQYLSKRISSKPETTVRHQDPPFDSDAESHTTMGLLPIAERHHNRLCRDAEALKRANAARLAVAYPRTQI